MVNLYITHDVIGAPSGGGLVTGMAANAFSALGEFSYIDRRNLSELYRGDSPSGLDVTTVEYIRHHYGNVDIPLAHIYSGCGTETVKYLKERGTKVCYHVDAHDPTVSKDEFEKLGLKFNFPHLTNPRLFSDYTEGYRLADQVITSSHASRKILEEQGCKDVIVIPYGTDVVPNPVAPPDTFTVGYLGQTGPDKGLRYLLEAWRLADVDGKLILAGSDLVQGSFFHAMANSMGLKNVEFIGRVKDKNDLYARCSHYVQPSATEGFGLAVLDAMAYGLPVICSRGAGVADVVEYGCGYVVSSCSAKELAVAIKRIKENKFERMREVAAEYTWERFGEKCREVWTGMLKPTSKSNSVLGPVSVHWAHTYLKEHWSRDYEYNWILQSLATHGYILNVGGAGDAISRSLSAQGHTIVDMDLDQRNVDRVKKDLPGVYAMQGDAGAIPFADETFNAVICCSVIEHAPSPHFKYIAEMWRVLKPGGQLLITCDVVDEVWDKQQLDAKGLTQMLDVLGLTTPNTSLETLVSTKTRAGLCNSFGNGKVHEIKVICLNLRK